MRKSNLLIFLISTVLVVSCSNNTQKRLDLALPILGPKMVQENGDTLYHTIGSYKFTDQHGKAFTEANTKGKVYVADFFFTSCPVQCPKMSSQMKRLATNTKDLEDLLFVSHAIDYKRDTMERIQDYIERNGLNFNNWYFLEAKEYYTNVIATEDYLMLSKEDVQAAGGYAHSPLFALVDKEGRIRGYYDGQITEEVDQLEKDLRKLFEIEYGRVSNQ